MFETAQTNEFPYARTAFAASDLPDRVIEAPAFLSLVYPVPARLGFGGVDAHRRLRGNQVCLCR